MGGEEGGESGSALHCSAPCNTPGTVPLVLAGGLLSSHPQASQSGHTIVVYEVALSVLRLVRHYAPNLEDREWEVVHRILHSTQQHLIQGQQVWPTASLDGWGSVILSVRPYQVHLQHSCRQHCRRSSPVLSGTGREAGMPLAQLISSSNF